jgi:hypothetical protein
MNKRTKQRPPHQQRELAEARALREDDLEALAPHAHLRRPTRPIERWPPTSRFRGAGAARGGGGGRVCLGGAVLRTCPRCTYRHIHIHIDRYRYRYRYICIYKDMHTYICASHLPPPQDVQRVAVVALLEHDVAARVRRRHEELPDLLQPCVAWRACACLRGMRGCVRGMRGCVGVCARARRGRVCSGLRVRACVRAWHAWVRVVGACARARVVRVCSGLRVRA